MLLTKKMFQTILVLGFSASIFLGCASVKMADIPTTADPREEIAKLDADLNEASTKNIDVLATREFRQSRSYLDKAKKELEKGKSQSRVLDSLRAAKGSLNQAYSEAGNRESHAVGLFAARQMALQAGAGSFPELQSELEDLDEDVSDRADKLADTDVEELSGYQDKYVDIERRSVVLSQLGKAQALVNGAEKEKASKKAPISFKKAELSLKTAESMISSNLRNPSGYQAAVGKARTDATQLNRVMATIKQNGNELDESVAIKMVAQSATISGLEQNLENVTAQGAADQSAMQAENDFLSSANASKTAALGRANSKVQVQKAIETARSEFSPAEAEAYQQGENLVIRLKKISFASGQSDLPEESLALLGKVLEIAKSLNSSGIRVEGHTDSVGTESINKTISQSRANAVATYFRTNGMSDVKIESEGFGYKKPIATNKSKEGRAQNRRVDVVITPNTSVE